MATGSTSTLMTVEECDCDEYQTFESAPDLFTLYGSDDENTVHVAGIDGCVYGN